MDLAIPVDLVVSWWASLPDPLSTFNWLLSRWQTIVVVCLLLVLWTVASGVTLARRGRRIQAALATASQRLSAEAARPLAAERFERLRTDLAQADVIGAPWRAFAESVVVPNEPGRPVRATRPAAELFDLGLYRRVDTDLRYHTALPGLLVGAGLLFTFFGLAIALANAGAIVTAAYQTARSTSLKGLLDAASIKFWTSLVGLLCSIGYAIYRKRSVNKTERSIDRFCALVEERLPLATSAFFQAEANQSLAAQRKSLDTLVNDLAQSIGPALDAALDARLGEHIAPLREAIEKLAAREAQDVSRTLETMLEHFLEKLGSLSTAQLETVARRLDEAAKGLAALRTSLETTATQLSSATGALSENLAKGSQAAADEFARRIEELAAQLVQLVQQQNKASVAQVMKLAEKIARIGEALANSAQAVGRTVEESGARAGETLEREARGAAAVLVSAADGLGKRLADAAERFEKAAEQTQTGAALFTAASDRLKGQIDAVAARIQQAAAALQSAAEEAGRELRTAAGEAFEDLRAASEPFTAATRDLKGTASVLQKTNERIEGLSGRLQDSVAGLAETTRTLASGLQQAQQLTSSLLVTGERFQRLDGKLGTTLERLAEQYEAFARRIADTVKEVDQNLAKAVTSLQAAIRDLSEAVDELQLTQSTGVRR